MKARGRPMADITATLEAARAQRLGQRQFCELLDELRSLPDVLLAGCTEGDDDSVARDINAAAAIVRESLEELIGANVDAQCFAGYCQALGMYLQAAVNGATYVREFSPAIVRSRVRNLLGSTPLPRGRDDAHLVASRPAGA